MVALLEPTRLDRPDSDDRTATGQHSARADALFDSGRLAEALLEYTKALESDPDDAYLRNNLGVALVRLERLEEAVSAFEQAVEMNQQNPMMLRNLAYALFESGREREAVDVLRKLPDHPIAAAARRQLVDIVLRRLADEGFATWSGGKPELPEKRLKLGPGPTASEYISGERDRLRN
jgi:Flp pilus assembly protein TadD